MGILDKFPRGMEDKKRIRDLINNGEWEQLTQESKLAVKPLGESLENAKRRFCQSRKPDELESIADFVRTLGKIEDPKAVEYLNRLVMPN